jgi:peptidylprolyl isomerase
MRAARLAVALCLPLVAAGCGGEEDGTDAAGPAPKARTIDRGAGPPVEIPGGAPPRRLVVEDLREGSGAGARRGDELEVEYVGLRWDGSPFTNSWERSKPFRFVLGTDDLLINPGWNKGLEGIEVGGRRKLIVPPDWQYRGGAPPEIGPDDTLVYVIDLISLR